MQSNSTTSGGFPHRHDQILQRCFAGISRFTLPFYSGRNGEVRIHGTGTLIQIATRYFVVTAAHVIDDLKERRHPFFLPPRNDEGQPFLLCPIDAFEWPMKPGMVRDDDPIDLCVVELAADAVEHLCVRRVFAQLSDLGSSRDPSPGLYLLTGYPLENEAYRSEERLSMTEPRHYVTEFHDDMGDPNRSLKFQIWLKYRRDQLVTSRGYEPRFPDPNGISGCGVWKMLPKPSGEWTGQDRKLVAVEHTHVQSRQLLQATRIELILKMFADEYPDLRGRIMECVRTWPTDN